MPDETINLTLPQQIKIKIDHEIESSDFADANEYLTDLLEVHFERKRILSLVDEAIKEDDYSPLTTQDFVDMKQELKDHIEAKKEQTA